MTKARCLIAAIGVGLCLCAIAKADDDQIPTVRNVSRPIVINRVTVVTGNGERVIYVRPAYPIHSVVSINRPLYSVTATRTHRRAVETSAFPIQESENHIAKATKSHRGSDTNQSEQQADKDNKSGDRKPEANQQEDAGALDRLTVQAQKEEQIRLAEPGGIEPR
jgi:hypothetical protein